MFTDIRGKIDIGSQHILEDDEVTRAMDKEPNSVYVTNPGIQKSLQDLGKKISPLAVIVLYHCDNGTRVRFLQLVSDLVDRPIFAYTGFLGWYKVLVSGRKLTIARINSKKNWRRFIRNRLVKQEFNYQPEDPCLGSSEGDWVVAIPTRFDVPIYDKLEKGFRKKIAEFEKKYGKIDDL